MSRFYKRVEIEEDVEIDIDAEEWAEHASQQEKEEMLELLESEYMSKGGAIAHVGEFRKPQNAHEELIWREFLEKNNFLVRPKSW